MSVQAMKTNLHSVIDSLPENKIQGLYIFMQNFVLDDDTYMSDEEFAEIEQIVAEMKNGEYILLDDLNID